jgi:hypothetical protein
MELKDAIQQAEKLLAATKVRPPTKKEKDAIQRLAQHAATSAQ